VFSNQRGRDVNGGRTRDIFFASRLRFLVFLYAERAGPRASRCFFSCASDTDASSYPGCGGTTRGASGRERVDGSFKMLVNDTPDRSCRANSILGSASAGKAA
jgi:hypothetical protein